MGWPYHVDGYQIVPGDKDGTYNVVKPDGKFYVVTTTPGWQGARCSCPPVKFHKTTGCKHQKFVAEAIVHNKVMPKVKDLTDNKELVATKASSLKDLLKEKLGAQEGWSPPASKAVKLFGMDVVSSEGDIHAADFAEIEKKLAAVIDGKGLPKKKIVTAKEILLQHGYPQEFIDKLPKAKVKSLAFSTMFGGKPEKLEAAISKPEPKQKLEPVKHEITSPVVKTDREEAPEVPDELKDLGF